jgi:hypothetical protein
MVNFRCRDCIWWDSTHPSLEGLVSIIPGLKIGYCRKHKPAAVFLHDKYWAEQPISDELIFCGEFKGENRG